MLGELRVREGQSERAKQKKRETMHTFSSRKPTGAGATPGHQEPGTHTVSFVWRAVPHVVESLAAASRDAH